MSQVVSHWPVTADTYSLEESPLEANRFSAFQEIPCILWNPKGHYRIHTCPYPEPARSRPYPTCHFLKIHLKIILPSKPGSPKWSPSLEFPYQNQSPSLRMEEHSRIWSVAANVLNKQSRRADKRWSFSLGGLVVELTTPHFKKNVFVTKHEHLLRDWIDTLV